MTKPCFVVLAPCCRCPHLGFANVGGDVATWHWKVPAVMVVIKKPVIIVIKKKDITLKKKNTYSPSDVSGRVIWAHFIP